MNHLEDAYRVSRTYLLEKFSSNVAYTADILPRHGVPIFELPLSLPIFLTSIGTLYLEAVLIQVFVHVVIIIDTQ